MLVNTVVSKVITLSCTLSLFLKIKDTVHIFSLEKMYFSFNSKNIITVQGIVYETDVSNSYMSTL